MQSKTFVIDDATVKDIQHKDAKARVMRQVMQNFVEQHKNDKSEVALDSAVFKRFQEMAIDADVEFECAKNRMFVSAVSEEKQKAAKDWSLNYYTKQLTVNC